MNCRETERLLDAFFDGELDGRLMRDAALHITRCSSCESEIQAKERARTVLADVIETQVQSTDLTALWAGIEAGLAKAATSPAEASRTEEDVGTPLRAPHRFGRRAGGRHGGVASRGSRRSLGRVSAAAGAGAVAVGLAAVLLFPAEQQEMLAENEASLAAQEAADAPVQVAEPNRAPAKSGTTFAKAAPRAVDPGRRATIEALARASQPPERLVSESQVQVGPVMFSDVAMSMWRGDPPR